jgi:uncharacterized membrane protein YkoI
MRKRVAIIGAALAVLVLGGATFAVGGGRGLIFDDGHYVQPGTLDDGKQLQPQAKISVTQAVAAAQQAAHGALGQVDLEQSDGRLVYSVDVGDQEVRVDAADGSIASTVPRD